MKTPQVKVEMLPHNPFFPPLLTVFCHQWHVQVRCEHVVVCMKQDLFGLNLHLATVS